MLYCDEFQRFRPPTSQRYWLRPVSSKSASTISNQVLEQLDDINRATALQAAVWRPSGSPAMTQKS